MEEDKGYNGFWKKFGQILAIPAALAIIGLLVSVGYLCYLAWHAWLEFAK